MVCVAFKNSCNFTFNPHRTYSSACGNTFTPDNTKLIEPIWNGESGLFPGESLYYFVSLAIAIILFEGGLTLRRSEILNVGPVIVKLITVAVAITFAGAGIAAHFILGLSWQISLLFSALIIVTELYRYLTNS